MAWPLDDDVPLTNKWSFTSGVQVWIDPNQQVPAGVDSTNLIQSGPGSDLRS